MGKRYILNSMFFASFFAAMVSLQGHLLDVEMADTPALRRRGLMWREELPNDHGMLFDYRDEKPMVRRMWMKNTKIPLSIAFFDQARRLVKVVDLDPPALEQEIPECSSEVPVLYALEVPQGWFSKYNIQPGAVLEFASK